MTLDTTQHPVARARQAVGMTQFELAVAIGRQPATISRIERGTHLPTLKTALRIAEVLDVPAADVFLWGIKAAAADGSEEVR